MAAELKLFTYVGITSTGAKVKGDLSAQSEAMAKQQLRAKGIKAKTLKSKKLGKVKISSTDIALITRQLQVMMQAGVPLVQSYDLIASGHPNPGARALATQIKQSLSDGNTLADSLAKYPEQFDHLYISLIDAGERSGALGSLLDRLSIYKEKSEALRAKIKKAVTYPIVIVCIGLGISTGLLLFVVPTFSEIFEGFGAELPALTQLFVDLSNGIKEYGIIMLFLLAGGFFGIRSFYQKSKPFRDAVDRTALQMPIAGDIIKNAVVARFTRTCSTMFAAGVSLIECLDSCVSVAGNSVYEDAIRDVKRNVSNGEPLFQAMGRSPHLFPSMAVQMIQIGEETGALEGMMERIANFYEEDVDTAVDNMTSLMEPLIMSFLGLMIGSLVIAMYLPIFFLGDAV